MNIEDIEVKIVKEFSLFDDWMDKYKYIIKLGTKLEELPLEDHIDDNLVKGCQSKVWLTANMVNDKLIFKADSDAAITKGLVALMIRVYSNQAPDMVLKNSPDFLKKIGLAEHLSPTRANGLANMVKQMKIYAMAYKAKQRN